MATADPAAHAAVAAAAAAAAAGAAAVGVGIAVSTAVKAIVVDASGSSVSGPPKSTADAFGAAGGTVTYSARTPASDIEAKRMAKKIHVAKLKSRLGLAPGQYLVGQLKYEGTGTSKAGKSSGKKGGGRSGGDAAAAEAAAAGVAGAVVAVVAGAGGKEGEGVDKDSLIGHLMKPLKGDEIDFSCQVCNP